jgi:hypothetical protein
VSDELEVVMKRTVHLLMATQEEAAEAMVYAASATWMLARRSDQVRRRLVELGAVEAILRCVEVAARATADEDWSGTLPGAVNPVANGAESTKGSKPAARHSLPGLGAEATAHHKHQASIVYIVGI